LRALELCRRCGPFGLGHIWAWCLMIEGCWTTCWQLEAWFWSSSVSKGGITAGIRVLGLQVTHAWGLGWGGGGGWGAGGLGPAVLVGWQAGNCVGVWAVLKLLCGRAAGSQRALFTCPALHAQPFSLTCSSHTPCCPLPAAPRRCSDGNLVASLMSHRMNVTQCNIAHALEKTKYRDADIRW
jgi:hypothetical protein